MAFTVRAMHQGFSAGGIINPFECSVLQAAWQPALYYSVPQHHHMYMSPLEHASEQLHARLPLHPRSHSHTLTLTRTLALTPTLILTLTRSHRYTLALSLSLGRVQR